MALRIALHPFVAALLASDSFPGIEAQVVDVITAWIKRQAPLAPKH